MLFPSSFWCETLLAWWSINFKDPQSKAEVLEEYLWYNSNIRINKKPVLRKKVLEAGIYKVKDIVDDAGGMKIPNSCDM